MLSLATHEPRFRVLREDVFAQEKGCRTCGEMGHYADRCPSKNRALLGTPEDDSGSKKPTEKKPFIFLDVSVLREYLEIELNVPYVPFAFDLERAIDDWIFLIFFVGNDFLPHLPSLEIREGAIDTLLRIWKEELPRMGGYLTNHGFVVMARAQIILEGLARREDDIFRQRREGECGFISCQKFIVILFYSLPQRRKGKIETRSVKELMVTLEQEEVAQILLWLRPYSIPPMSRLQSLNHLSIRQYTTHFPRAHRLISTSCLQINRLPFYPIPPIPSKASELWVARMPTLSTTDEP